MIHTIFKRGYFDYCVYVIFVVIAYEHWGELDKEDLWLSIGLFVFCMGLAVLAFKCGTNTIQCIVESMDFFIACMWCYFGNYKEGYYFFDSAFKQASIYSLIYAFLCFSLLEVDSTRNLSRTKIVIAATVLTPIVMFGLLKYNNKQSEDETEKYILRTQRAIEDGAYEEALRSAEKALDICSRAEKYELAKCYYWRGKAHRLLGKNTEATADLHQASELGTGATFLAEVEKELSTMEE